MSELRQPGDPAAPGEDTGGPVLTHEARADEIPTSHAVRTYDRPAAAARSRPNVLAIVLVLLILALMAYAAFQVIR